MKSKPQRTLAPREWTDDELIPLEDDEAFCVQFMNVHRSTFKARLNNPRDTRYENWLRDNQARHRRIVESHFPESMKSHA